MTNEGATEAAETEAAETEVVEVGSEAVIEDGADAPEIDGAVGMKPGRALDVRKRASLVVLVALWAATGVLGWMAFQQRQLNAARDAAQATAVNYAQILTSIDSDKVDDNFKKVLDGATGEFKDMYSQSSVELRQLLVENKATAHGVVIESAVQSISTDKAVVLLFVDQSVSNTKLPDPRIDRSRMKMTLEKVDGAWRASKVELP